MQPRLWRLFAWVLLALWSGWIAAREPQPGYRLGSVQVNALPPEARETLKLIKAGGPFPYGRDGVVFQNREGILAPRPRGYYREYTVRTPGLQHRGARRIVTGKASEYYCTADHYRSFKRIIE
ncbi:MAG: ribonuclease [Betaproteobacteria bacterium]|nr:ribonuclease [Betaproteobacteria bacterium]